jgi:hypothetical protein
VSAFFTRRAIVSIQNVFIIMPFGEESVVTKNDEHTYTKAHFDDLYRILVDAVTGYKKKITVDRMQQPYGNLVSAIIKRLATADVVIGVLTGRNPNVFYELGIRHSLRKNTIMLVEHWDEYPFDLNSYFSRRYSIKHESDRDDLKTFIKSRLTDLESTTLPDSPVMDVLSTSEFEQLRVINAWETRRAALLIDGLVREALGVYGVFVRCLDYTHELRSGKAGKRRPLITLDWDVMEGFRKNRPVPGLPAVAYSDAEDMSREWSTMQELWNEHLNTKREADANKLQGIIATAERTTVAFLYDLLGAWSYVMDRQVCFGIPWPGSMSKVESLIPTTDSLVMVRSKVLREAETRRTEFRTFDRGFLGVPESMIHDALESVRSCFTGISSIIQAETKEEGEFGKLVKKASAKPKRASSQKASRVQTKRVSAGSRTASARGKPKKTSRPSAKKTRRAANK